MIIAVYKKKGPTSRDLLNEIKRVTKEKKVGHAGTLDPLAEGVLVVGIGRESTKELFSGKFQEKEYLAVIKLGEKSSTDDMEGDKEKVFIEKPPFLYEVEKVLASFKGTIMQAPPVFSAVKIKGKEAYKWAREGTPRNPKKRKVFIKSTRLLKYKYPYLKIKITTGKGVYIRSLARDIGRALGTGGYLHSLLRLRVGKFTVSDCVPVESLPDRLN